LRKEKEMDNLLLYLLKVTAGTALFYLTYLVFFRKETFYLRNRVFLMLTLFLPTVFPLLKIPVTVNTNIPSEPVNEIINLIPSGTVSDTTMVTAAVNDSFDLTLLFTWIYLAVAAALLLRGLISLFSTFRIIRKGVIQNNQFPRVVISDLQHPPFSFFPYAVIPSKEFETGEYGDILDHEFAHIRQGHTFDLLLSEIFIAFQWFNPVVWLIKRSVILNHEYLADQVSINSRSAKEYQYRLLNFNAGIKNMALAHTFNSLIQNRIIMINKKPTNRYFVWKNMLVLPVILAAVYAFAAPEYRYVAHVNEPLTIQEAPVILREERINNKIQNDENPPATQKVSAIVQKEIKGYVIHNEGKPLSGASIIISGTTLSTFSDEKGFFRLIELPDDFLIVVSKEGFRTKIIEPVFNAEMVVKMVRDTIYENKPASDSSLTSAISTGTKYSGSISTGPPPPPPIPTDANGNILKPSFPDRYLKIRSEGNGSPLYVKDGMVTDITVNKIDPLTIESITVLKGETALKKYGERARDGAIEIKTKKDIYGGQVEKPVYIEVSKTPREPTDNNIPFVIVENMPAFPGGNEAMLSWIANNIKYPEEALRQKVEGIVTIRFVITSEGKIENIVVLKSDNQIFNDEAIRVVSNMPPWKPGSQNGRKVDVYSMVPVEFKLK
jgi:TonB family protein